MRQTCKCNTCGKSYKEKFIAPKVFADGTRLVGENIPDICDKCFMKKRKLAEVISRGILSGRINIREAQDLKDKKLSRDKFDAFIRERKDGFYDNKDDIEKMRDVLSE